MNSSFASIAGKVESGERITDADALFLFRSSDLLEIGELAAQANEEKNGNRVFFNVNRHINHTNICVNRCTFCAFSKTADEPGAYAYDLEEIGNRAAEAAPPGGDRDPHGRRAPSRSPLRVLPGDAPDGESGLSRPPHQGLHRRGDRLPGADSAALHRGNPR